MLLRDVFGASDSRPSLLPHLQASPFDWSVVPVVLWILKLLLFGHFSFNRNETQSAVTNMTKQQFYNMRCFVMFVTAVCVLFLLWVCCTHPAPRSLLTIKRRVPLVSGPFFAD